MTIFHPVSRGIFASLIIMMFYASSAGAQDRFGAREMANHSGVGGYNTYHDNLRVDGDRPHHDYQPEPSVTRSLLREVDVEKNPANDDGSFVEAGTRPTQLEVFYRKRSRDNQLNQFGYNLFYHFDKKQNKTFQRGGLNAPMGVVQDDYVLQVGDELSVTFLGERKGRDVYKIKSDGRLLIENLPSIQAAGKTLGALKLDVEILLVDMGYRGQASISIEGIRQIGVLIAGHVEKPGRHNMNAFHSVIDAIQMAGGIRKTGSLRQVKLIRKGQTKIVDLYGFLDHGHLPERLQLSDGDRIIVPPIGPTIAVTGDVKQAGIFELRVDPRLVWRKSGVNTAHKVSLKDALKMAGGVLSAGDNQFTLQNSQSKIIDLNNIKQSVIGDGSILTVIRAEDTTGNAVTLSGYSRKNGLYDLSSAPTLQKLIRGRNVFGDDIYPMMGVISRVNRKSLIRKMMGFSPQSIAIGRDDRQLEAGDVVYLFSHEDIADIKKEEDDARKLSDPKDQKEKSKFPKLVRDFVRDSAVTIQGAVRDPGMWPVGNAGDLQTLISVAGGLTSKADIQNIEVVTRNGDGTHERQKLNGRDQPLKSINLYAGDQVRVNERFETAIPHAVKVTGEVRNPGTYDLMRGDTLSSILARAGGLTEEAYPPSSSIKP